MEELHGPALDGLGRVLGQVVEQVASQQRRVDLGRCDEMTDAVLSLHLRAAQGGRVDVFAGDLRHDARPRQEHAGVLGHDHEVGQGGRVGAAARRRAADHRDLGDESRKRDVLAEDPPVPGERGEPLLHSRARRLDEADHRHARALGELEDLHDGVGMGLTQ